MLTQDAIEQLKAQHGKISLIEIEGESEEETQKFIARRPNRFEYQRITEAMLSQEPKKQINGIRDFVLACVVFPAKEELVRKLDEDPTLLDLLAKPLTQIAGTKREVVTKKL